MRSSQVSRCVFKGCERAALLLIVCVCSASLAKAQLLPQRNTARQSRSQSSLQSASDPATHSQWDQTSRKQLTAAASYRGAPQAPQQHDHLAFLGPDGLLPEERVAIAVYKKCNQGVVHISTKSRRLDAFLRVTVSQGSGSGSIIDTSGIVLTNHHVIDGAREITVNLHDGRSLPAKIIGQDPPTDIALLKIEPGETPLQTIAISDAPIIEGQRIYAIGNPFGLERTMGRGMISSLNRAVASSENRTMRSLIQLDADLNQGNSGGPLLNTRGDLIGMNTAIMTADGDSSGVGFAIPVSTIQRIVPQLLRHGQVLRPSLGITRVYEKEDGQLLVVSLEEGGPADRAGLRGFQVVIRKFQDGVYVYEQSTVDPSSADTILAVDGQKVSSADDLLDSIEGKQPGDQVTLTIVRDGKQLQLPIVLGRS
ncbi:MAG TPA: serine protease [Planctomycetaceae bacterium]|nr:serine protease [Planctomycetaceae bacterium]